MRRYFDRLGAHVLFALTAVLLALSILAWFISAALLLWKAMMKEIGAGEFSFLLLASFLVPYLTLMFHEWAAKERALVLIHSKSK